MKLHFSSSRVLQVWKNVFLSNFSLSKFSYRLCFMTHHVREWKYMTKWKDLSSRFWIKQLFFEKSHFDHLHAQKTLKKQRKSFTFCLKKSKKIQNFCFSKNCSIWLLMLPNASLSTPRTPKHLLEAPTPPRDTSKKFSKNRFLDLKLHFSSLRVLQAWKTCFWAIFSFQNFPTDFVSCP